MSDNEEDFYNYESPFDDEEDWKSVEAKVDLKAATRILELRLDPNIVKGDFDAEHLKNIHGHIFQDSAEYMNAGGFREPTHPDYHHAKQRKFYDVDHYMFYAGEPTDKSVNNAIKDSVKKLGEVSEPKEFSSALADMYAKLDYQHPFDEGNSRTLREFTRLVAEKHGYDLDWDKTNKDKVSQIELYVARDSHLIDQNFDFTSKNMKFLKAFDPSLHNQHSEYIDSDMVNYLAEHKEVNGFRDLPEIIDSSTIKISQKLDADLGAELDDDIKYVWQKDGAEDATQANQQNIDNTSRIDVKYSVADKNLQSEQSIKQQRPETETPSPEQAPRPNRRRP